MLNASSFYDRIKSKNLLIKLFLSYLGTAILAVILITTFLTYRIRNESIKDINNMTELALSNISMLSSNVFETASKTAYEIFNNFSVKNILYSTDKNNLDKVYAAMYINNLIILNPFIYSVYVCDSNSIVFKTSQDYNFEEDYRQLSGFLEKSNVLTPIPRQLKNKNGEVLDIYSVIFHAGNAGDKNIDAVVIVNINASYLYKQIYSSNLRPKQDIMLVDKDGTILLHNDMTLFTHKISNEQYYQNAIKSAPGSGYFTVSSSGHNLIYSYVFDEQRKYMVLSSSEYDAFFSQITKMQRTVIFVSMIILVIITLLSVLLSYKLFKPINNVFQNVRTLFKNSAYNEKQMTEVNLISQAFSGLIMKLNNLESDSITNFTLQRTDFIKTLLTTNHQLSESNITESMVKYKILENTDESYILVIFRIDNFKQFTDNNTKEAIDFQLSSIGNIACESLKPDFKCAAFEIYPEHILLIVKAPLQKEHPEIDNKLMELIKRCQNTVYQLLNIEITAGISDCSGNISDIRERYNQAYGYTNYRLLYGRRSIIHPGTVKTDDPNSKKLGYLMDSAVNAVKSNALDSYRNYLGSLFMALKTSSHEIIVKKFFQLANSILRIPMDFQANPLQTAEYDLENINARIKSFENYEELEAWFIDLFHQTNRIISGIKNIKTPNFIDSIIEFISENYADSSLSANLMAEKLSFTPQYFSKVFNEYTGISFPDYVNNVRLEKAKELLLSDPRLSSVKICNMVGYNNSTYFTSSFSRKFGISPGKFKNSVKYENLQ